MGQKMMWLTQLIQKCNFQLEYSDDIHEILLNTWYKQGL